jgi:hypothetical protein
LPAGACGPWFPVGGSVGVGSCAGGAAFPAGACCGTGFPAGTCCADEAATCPAGARAGCVGGSVGACGVGEASGMAGARRESYAVLLCISLSLGTPVLRWQRSPEATRALGSAVCRGRGQPLGREPSAEARGVACYSQRFATRLTPILLLLKDWNRPSSKPSSRSRACQDTLWPTKLFVRCPLLPAK